MENVSGKAARISSLLMDCATLQVGLINGTSQSEIKRPKDHDSLVVQGYTMPLVICSLASASTRQANLETAVRGECYCVSRPPSPSVSARIPLTVYTLTKLEVVCGTVRLEVLP